MTNKRRRRGKQEESAAARSATERVPTPRRRSTQRRWPWKLVIALVLLGVFVFCLPSLVVRTPLKQVLIDRLLAGFGGRVTIQEISCGWITNIELRGIEATDHQGQPLFQVSEVKLQKSLTSLLGVTDLGTIEIKEPSVQFHMRPQGSNLEDALANLFAGEESSEPAVGMRFVIADGSIQMTDQTSSQSFAVESLQGLVEAFQPDEAPLKISVAGRAIHESVATPGSFEAKLVFDAGKTQLEFQNGLVELTTEAFPLQAAAPLLTRFVEPVSLAGMLSGSLQAVWSQFGDAIQVQMEPLQLTDLDITAARFMGTDQIRLKNALAKGKLTITPLAIEADRFVCQTDIGSLNANGEMNWEQIAAVAGAQIPANNFQAEGTIQLGPLVHMLPETIPLQAGLQIQSGTLQFHANSRVEGTDRRLVVNLESTGLTALRDGQVLNWDKPARIVAAVRQTRDNLLYIESLDCRTNFLTLTGSANTVHGEFRVQGDLQSALTEVRQFVDLQGMQLEGKINGEFAWQFDGSPADALSSRPVRAGGRFHIDRPLVDLPGKAAWSQPELNVLVQLAGQRTPDPATAGHTLRLDSGKLELGNAGQRLEANLVEPVIDPGLHAAWKLDCQVGGDLQTWLSQLASVTAVSVAASGDIAADGTITLQPLKQLTVHQLNYELSNFNYRGPGWQWNEPQLGGQAQFHYAWDRGRWEVIDATCAASAFSARAQNVVFDPQDIQRPLTGQLAFAADVNRCLATLGSRSDPQAVQWFGRAEGSLMLEASRETMGGQINVKLNDLIAARYQPPQAGVQNVSSGAGRWSRLLEEKEVDLQSTLQLSRDLNSISFQQTKLTAAAAELIASGTVGDLTGSLQTDIQGSWNPNWPRLKPLADAWLSGLANLDGVGGGQFRVQGPVFHAQTGQPGQPWLNPGLQVATFGTWQSGQALGLPIGGGKFDLQLTENVAGINTGVVPFSGGSLQLRPQLDLRSDIMILRLPPGMVLDQVELTPEVCRSWLKFVAPAIAGATTAKGRISLATSQVQIPLGQWDAASANGVVTVHQASVGPGPLGQQLFGMISQVKALAQGSPFQALPAAKAEAQWLTLAPKEIPFAVQNGRVFHQGMEFQVEGVTIRTSGSVGLDQSMDLVAEIPILPAWLGQGPLTKGLQGQTLRIPIRGTVQKPNVDAHLFQNMSQKLFRQAAGSTINNEMQGLLNKGNQQLEEEFKKGLKGLFGPGK